jgi:anti-sigma regulatory factor (Ser/Thr protein kinase)
MEPGGEQVWILPSDSTAAARGRELIAAECGDLMRDQLDVVILLVSELVGNAVRHGAGTVVLHVTRDDHTLRVEVQDEGPDMPVMVDVQSWTEMESGAGLRLVDALSNHWGVAPRGDELPGKRVWFALRLTV